MARPMPVKAPVIRTTEVFMEFSLWWSRAQSNLHPRTGSVGAVSAIDVEDVTGDEPGFVRCDEHDAVGDLLREAQAT